jgi:hypothetical protein
MAAISCSSKKNQGKIVLQKNDTTDSTLGFYILNDPPPPSPPVAHVLKPYRYNTSLDLRSANPNSDADPENEARQNSKCKLALSGNKSKLFFSEFPVCV